MRVQVLDGILVLGDGANPVEPDSPRSGFRALIRDHRRKKMEHEPVPVLVPAFDFVRGGCYFLLVAASQVRLERRPLCGDVFALGKLDRRYFIIVCQIASWRHDDLDRALGGLDEVPGGDVSRGDGRHKVSMPG